MDQSIKDYDALCSKTRRFIVGGKQFSVSHIPAIVAMMFTRHAYGVLTDDDGEAVDIVALKLQALVAVLNSHRSEAEWVNEEWVMRNIPSEIYDDLVDDLLGPFYEARKRADQRNQNQMVNLMGPAIQAAVREELAKQRNKSQRSSKRR